MILLIEALGALGSIEAFLLGQPRALLAAVRGRGNKTIEFYPPDGGCPGDVTRYLKARGIATWAWTGYLKQGRTATRNANRRVSPFRRAKRGGSSWSCRKWAA